MFGHRKHLAALALTALLCLPFGSVAFAESGNKEIGDYITDSYTVTIPAEIVLTDDGTGKVGAELEVDAKLEKYHTLNICIASANDWNLNYLDENGQQPVDGPQLPYSLTGAEDGTDENIGKKTLKFHTNAIEDTALTATLGLELTDPENAVISGDYKDVLTFEVSCAADTCEVDVYYERMNGSTMHVHQFDSLPRKFEIEKYKLFAENGTVSRDMLYELGIIGKNEDGSEDAEWKDRWEDCTYSVEDTGRPITLKIMRQMVWLNLNALVLSEDRTYVKCQRLRDESRENIPPMGTVDAEIWVGDENKLSSTEADDINDTGYPAVDGSFKISNIRIDPNYELVGYFFNTMWDVESVPSYLTPENLDQYCTVEQLPEDGTIQGTLKGLTAYVDHCEMQTVYLVLHRKTSNVDPTDQLQGDQIKISGEDTVMDDLTPLPSIDEDIEEELDSEEMTKPDNTEPLPDEDESSTEKTEDTDMDLNPNKEIEQELEDLETPEDDILLEMES